MDRRQSWVQEESRRNPVNDESSCDKKKERERERENEERTEIGDDV